MCYAVILLFNYLPIWTTGHDEHTCFEVYGLESGQYPSILFEMVLAFLSRVCYMGLTGFYAE